MTAVFMRPCAATLLLLALTACAAPVSAEMATSAPVLGIDLGGSGPATGHAEGHAPYTQHHGAMQMAHGGHNDAHGSGIINAIDPARHKLTISHGPIPAIGFPAMTMDFAVAPAVNLAALKPGMRVDFTIAQDQTGIYQIEAVSPAEGHP